MSHQAIENEYNALLACHAVTGNIVKPVRGDGYKKMAKLMGMSDRDCENVLGKARKKVKTMQRSFHRQQIQENAAAEEALEAEIELNAASPQRPAARHENHVTPGPPQRPVQPRRQANRETQTLRRSGNVDPGRQPNLEIRRDRQQVSPPRTPTVVGDRRRSPAASVRRSRLNRPQKGRRMTLQVSLNAIIKTPMRDEHWAEHPELKAFIEAGASV